MLADHLRVDVGWIDPEVAAKMDAKAQAVEKRARTEDSNAGARSRAPDPLTGQEGP